MPRGAAHRAQLGKRAETLVAAYLERQGFQIVDRNIRVGRLEIDIIARRGGLIVFCEVRARSSDRVMAPVQSIDRKKAARVRSAAARWLTDSRLHPSEVRLDVASVVYDTPEGRVEYYEAAL